MAVELKVLVSMMSAPASRLLPVNILDDVRLGDIQNVVATGAGPAHGLRTPRHDSRPPAALGLDHRTHGAVDDHDAAFQGLDKRFMRGTKFIHTEEGCS